MTWQERIVVEFFKLFRRSSKSLITHEIVDIVKGRIFRYKGIHRIALIEITNGGSTLTGEEDMYFTILYICEDNKYLSSLPPINRVKIDESFREFIREVINHKIAKLYYGETEEGMLKELMRKYGANYSESHLIKKSKRSIIMITLSTTEIETNPIEQNQLEIEIDIGRIRNILNKK